MDFIQHSAHAYGLKALLLIQDPTTNGNAIIHTWEGIHNISFSVILQMNQTYFKSPRHLKKKKQLVTIFRSNRIYKATTVKDPPQKQIGDGEAFGSDNNKYGAPTHASHLARGKQRVDEVKL